MTPTPDPLYAFLYLLLLTVGIAVVIFICAIAWVFIIPLLPALVPAGIVYLLTGNAVLAAITFFAIAVPLFRWYVKSAEKRQEKAIEEESKALEKIRELEAEMPREPQVILLNAGERVKLAGCAYCCEYYNRYRYEWVPLCYFPRVYLTDRRLIIEGGREGGNASISLGRIVGVMVTEEGRPIPALEVTTTLSGYWRRFRIKIPEAEKWREAIASCKRGSRRALGGRP